MLRFVLAMPVVASLILAILVCLQMGCATVQTSSRISTCLTDPINNQLHCDGKSQPWSESGGYVCHKLEDHAEYMRGCR